MLSLSVNRKKWNLQNVLKKHWACSKCNALGFHSWLLQWQMCMLQNALSTTIKGSQELLCGFWKGQCTLPSSPLMPGYDFYFAGAQCPLSRQWNHNKRIRTVISLWVAFISFLGWKLDKMHQMYSKYYQKCILIKALLLIFCINTKLVEVTCQVRKWHVVGCGRTEMYGNLGYPWGPSVRAQCISEECSHCQSATMLCGVDLVSFKVRFTVPVKLKTLWFW